MDLTTAQHMRLDRLPERARVIGLVEDCPVVLLDGRVHRIDTDGHCREPILGAARRQRPAALTDFREVGRGAQKGRPMWR
jgi:hypothetical protein